MGVTPPGGAVAVPKAFRLLDFGCQLAQHQRIVDLAAANGIFELVKRIWEQLRIQTGRWAATRAGNATGEPGMEPRLGRLEAME